MSFFSVRKTYVQSRWTNQTNKTSTIYVFFILNDSKIKMYTVSTKCKHFTKCKV